jgi:hypothetical protein
MPFVLTSTCVCLYMDERTSKAQLCSLFAAFVPYPWTQTWIRVLHACSICFRNCREARYVNCNCCYRNVQPVGCKRATLI